MGRPVPSFLDIVVGKGIPQYLPDHCSRKLPGDNSPGWLPSSLSSMEARLLPPLEPRDLLRPALPV